MSRSSAIRSSTLAVVALLQACDPDANIGFWAAPRGALPPSAASVAGAAGTKAVPGDDSTAHGNPAGVDGGLVQPVTTRTGGAGGAAAATADAGVAPKPDACQLALDASIALTVTVVDPEAMLYDFADGARFPAGRYRVSYVDGCHRYDATGAWTVHATALASGLSAQGRGGCYLVMSNGQALDLAPGTAGVLVGEGSEPAGGFASYAECVAANRMLPPLELSFAGGTLGIMNGGDSTQAKTRGEDVGGRSPTYRLTRLDACP